MSGAQDECKAHIIQMWDPTVGIAGVGEFTSQTRGQEGQEAPRPLWLSILSVSVGANNTWATVVITGLPRLSPLLTSRAHLENICRVNRSNSRRNVSDYVRECSGGK